MLVWSIYDGGRGRRRGREGSFSTSRREGDGTRGKVQEERARTRHLASQGGRVYKRREVCYLNRRIVREVHLLKKGGCGQDRRFNNLGREGENRTGGSAPQERKMRTRGDIQQLGKVNED